MKTLYPRLAATGISKNKSIYLPFLLSAIGMVAMFYILCALGRTPNLNSLPCGREISGFMEFGSYVVGIFCVLLLFYSYSFLLKRRQEEFGLYYVLGMGKRNIAGIQLWETLFLFLISLSVGLILGIVCSKLAELLLLRILFESANFEVVVSPAACGLTVLLFGGIFLLLTLHAVMRISRSRPVQMIQNSRAGEKAPRANFVFALLGAGILAVAYVIAVRITSPIDSLKTFAFAVILVIVGTYLLFMSGSVAVCRLLQKNKRYYYKVNHFVSVSSMAFRMKRNGAGLASICILSTMLLVTVSTTACLYFGLDQILENKYVRDVEICQYTAETEYIDRIEAAASKACAQYGVSAEDVLKYRQVRFYGTLENGIIQIDEDNPSQMFLLMTLDDYNLASGGSDTLSENEIMICSSDEDVFSDSITFDGESSYTVAKTYDALPASFGNDALSDVTGEVSVCIVTANEDVENDIISQAGISDVNGRYYYGFNLTCSDEIQIGVYSNLIVGLHEAMEADDTFPYTGHQSLANDRDTYMADFGSLFFLGILLGTVFLAAAVLMIYYKQVTEGYEDAARFEIMKKVGLTDKEVRQSIRSQTLTVFFMPLITAGLHTAFAFPVISRLMRLASLRDTAMLAGITAGCFLAFALLYVAVYLITSKTYYHIVSQRKEAML